MSDQRIEAFRDALAAGDHVEAIEAFDDFDEALSIQDLREGALRTLARAVVARTSASDPANTAAQQFLSAVTAAQQARLQTRYDFMLYLVDGPSASAVAEKVDGVIDAHAAVAGAEASLRANRGDVSLPPMLAAFGTDDRQVPEGQRFEATVTVENVGTSDIDEVAVSTEGYEASASPSTLGPLAADEAATVTVAGTADQSGDFDLVVRAAATDANAADSHRITLHVLSKADYLELASTTLEELRERIDPDAPQGLANKVRTANNRIEALLEQLEGGPGKGNGGGRSIDNRIESVINLLGAFQNQVDGLSGSRLAAREAAILLHDSGEVIDQLDGAITAAA